MAISSLLKSTLDDWLDDNALRLSAALAYYSVFSIAPLLVLSIGLAGWFFGADAVRGHVEAQLRDFVGPQAAQTIQSMVQSTSHPTASLLATAVGVTVLLIGASGVFGQLKDALNTIWEVKQKPGLGWRAIVRERMLSFGMVLVIGFLLLTSFVLTTLLSALSRWIEAILRLPDWVWGGAGLLVSFAVVTVLFAMIFKVLPDVRIQWRHVWIGAVATALLFEVGKFGLAFYLGRESTVSGFGAAGSVVLVLLWVYYASCILLFGAEFTKVYARASGGELRPSNLAVPVTPEARAQQGLLPHDEPQPPRETLAAVFARGGPVETTGRNRQQGIAEFVREHMAAGLLGALGCGVAVGLASRVVPPSREDGPGAQIRLGSKMLGAASLILLTRAGRETANRVAARLSRIFHHHAIPWK